MDKEKAKDYLCQAFPRDRHFPIKLDHWRGHWIWETWALHDTPKAASHIHAALESLGWQEEWNTTYFKPPAETSSHTVSTEGEVKTSIRRRMGRQLYDDPNAFMV